MAQFVTLEQVKDILGICDSLEDTRLQAILDSVLDSIDSRIGNIEAWDKTEKILKTTRLVKDDILPLSCIKPTQIKSIDWVDFTGKVEGSDYLLLDNWTAQVPDLSSYISTDFDYFTVVYTAWYDTAPAEFVRVVANLVGLEYSKDMWKDMIEESTGPRTIRWSDTWKDGGDTVKKSLYASLRKYIPIHLRVY